VVPDVYTHGHQEPVELASIEVAWQEWAAGPDAVFVVPSVEVIARR
jgi:hypothetical protein